MATEMPHGRALDTDFMFTKLQVDDLEKSAAFYMAVCGLVELQRVEAEIAGRRVSEICYRSTYPGGPMFILAKFHDAPKGHNDELILGFATRNLEAFLARAELAGGSVAEPIQENPRAGLRHAFVRDIEGHLLQVSQPVGQSGSA